MLIPAFAQIGQTYPSRVITITGACEAELRPATAVVSGGVAVSALKPSSAADQLDKQMKLIREYVQQNQGKLKELERVRMIHTEGSINGQPRDPSFQLAQRIRAEFPADAPIDSLLEHLIELGLDRFGDNMSAAESRQSIVVIRYELENFDEQLKEIRSRCTTEAWKRWCVSAGAQSLSCKANDLPESLQLQSLTLRSTEKVMRGEGPTDYYRISISAYPSGQQASPPELLGNLPLHLVGNIVLNNSESETK
ncbi:MAG TPA: SIMPL domain-containing protein [Candidatus Eisenbacteria bacterium]|nr:SIMPL domain-containing protein [Candidatus Eisenbacteria bacterium]